MNPQLPVWLGAFGLGLLGAALGAWWLSGRLRVQWASEMQHLLQAELEAHARMQFQALHAASGAADASALDTALLAGQLRSQLTGAFDAQREALQQARQQADDSLHQALQRMPQAVRQAIQVELDFQAHQQAERDAACAAEQQRWHAEQDERRAADLRVLLQALTAPPPARATRIAAPALEPPRPLVPGAPARHPAAGSARPPELEMTPLPRPEPSLGLEVATPELSDEELDAMPPDLPEPGKARKRIPPPKRPPFRRL